MESSVIFILGFLLPSFYKYIREPLKTENYKVLLFRNDYESFHHCCTLKSLSSTLFEILGRVSLLQEGGPLPEPKTGLLSNTQ